MKIFCLYASFGWTVYRLCMYPQIDLCWIICWKDTDLLYSWESSYPRNSPGRPATLQPREKHSRDSTSWDFCTLERESTLTYHISVCRLLCCRQNISKSCHITPSESLHGSVAHLFWIVALWQALQVWFFLSGHPNWRQNSWDSFISNMLLSQTSCKCRSLTFTLIFHMLFVVFIL